jgi:hypothetical protein
MSLPATAVEDARTSFIAEGQTQRLESTGSLDSFGSILVTPVIGTEFPKGKCNIVDDILNGPNAEQRIRDLAVLSKPWT